MIPLVASPPGYHFAWVPEEWTEESTQAWSGAYHEASHAVHALDLGYVPNYITVQAGNWSVACRIPRTEGHAVLISASGIAISMINARDRQAEDAALWAIRVSHGDLDMLKFVLTKLEEATADTEEPYVKPPDEDVEGMYDACGMTLMTELILNPAKRAPLDPLAKHLYEAHFSGKERVEWAEVAHMFP